jgi:hypothetical protein
VRMAEPVTEVRRPQCSETLGDEWRRATWDTSCFPFIGPTDPGRQCSTA